MLSGNLCYNGPCSILVALRIKSKLCRATGKLSASSPAMPPCTLDSRLYDQCPVPRMYHPTFLFCCFPFFPWFPCLPNSSSPLAKSAVSPPPASPPRSFPSPRPGGPPSRSASFAGSQFTKHASCHWGDPGDSTGPQSRTASLMGSKGVPDLGPLAMLLSRMRTPAFGLPVTSVVMA